MSLIDLLRQAWHRDTAASSSKHFLTFLVYFWKNPVFWTLRFYAYSFCPSLFSLLPSLSLFLSCGSYFSLLPGARRSVPDGNLLRLQEPPWRPHGGGTEGEQSSPVLFAPMYSSSSSPSPTVVSFPLSPPHPACQATRVLRVTCFRRGSLSFTHRFPQLLPKLPPRSPSSGLPGGKTARPSSPELSISQGVYSRRDRPTHLERIFAGVHTPSPPQLLPGLYILSLPPEAFTAARFSVKFKTFKTMINDF